MGSLKDKFITFTQFIQCFRKLMQWSILSFHSNKKWGYIGKGTIVGFPLRASYPKEIYFSDFVKVRYGCNIINAIHEKVIIKKFSVIAPLCTIITNSHVPTVGIPQFILGESHINDKSKDVIIEEDVWIGAKSTILAGVTIGRGVTIGACSLVTKNIPPYALAVGSPARIVGVKFSKDGILKHEKELYCEEERLSEEEIDKLFNTYYNGLKVFGIEKEITEEQKNIINDLNRKHNMN